VDGGDEDGGDEDIGGNRCMKDGDVQVSWSGG